MNVKIVTGSIMFDNKEIRLGMNYKTVLRILEDILSIENEPKTPNGAGHMYIDEADFCGLKGSCTMYFSRGLLKQLDFHPSWNRYDPINKNTGKEMEIEEEICRIAKENWTNLENEFGKPYSYFKDRSRTFLSEGMRIDGIITKDKDFYTVSLRTAN